MAALSAVNLNYMWIAFVILKLSAVVPVRSFVLVHNFSLDSLLSRS